MTISGPYKVVSQMSLICVVLNQVKMTISIVAIGYTSFKMSLMVKLAPQNAKLIWANAWVFFFGDGFYLNKGCTEEEDF